MGEELGVTHTSHDRFTIEKLTKDELNKIVEALETQVTQKNLWNRRSYAALLAELGEAVAE